MHLAADILILPTYLRCNTITHSASSAAQFRKVPVKVNRQTVDKCNFSKNLVLFMVRLFFCNLDFSNNLAFYDVQLAKKCCEVVVSIYKINVKFQQKSEFDLYLAV